VKRALPTLLFILWCSSCGGKTGANEGNFAAAINAYYAQHPECFLNGAYPEEVQVSGDERSDTKIDDALVSAGLLRREEFTRADTFRGRGTIHYNRYLLTDLGQKTITKNLWCYGNRKVEKIVKFTEPAEGLGVKMAEVDYTYSLANIPDWAKSPAVLDAFPNVRRAVSPTEPPHDTQTLVLTNQGWEAK